MVRQVEDHKKAQCFDGFKRYEVMCATVLFQAQRDGWHFWTSSYRLSKMTMTSVMNRSEKKWTPSCLRLYALCKLFSVPS